MTYKKSYSIKKGAKVPPKAFILSGWQCRGDDILFFRGQPTKATLLIDVEINNDVYFMAEVSSLTQHQPESPLRVSISVNGQHVDDWTVDSTEIHDKLITIPQTIAVISTPTIITFEFIDDPILENGANNSQGIQLHSISTDTTLDAYLKELQTGYDWSCTVRTDFIDTVKNVLYFLRNLDNTPKEIEEKLISLLNDPYVLSNASYPITFDRKYFRDHYSALKEGTIHQAIRQWVASIQEFNNKVIDVGNYATNQPGLKCYDTKTLQSFLPRYEYNEKIEQLRSLNEQVNNLEILLKKTELQSVPSTLYLDITNSCNFRCRMCYQSKSHFLQTNLTNKHMLSVLQMLPYIEQITVAGLGEPLLSRNLAAFAHAARKLRCNTSLITNGSLIHNNLDTIKLFSSVSISFDSADAKVFEIMRNRSNFKKIIKNIKLLREYAPDLRISFSVVVSRINIEEISAIAEIAGQLSINEINMTPMEHMPSLELKASDANLFDEQLQKVHVIAKQYKLKINNSVIPTSFITKGDSPRDKAALLNSIRSVLPIKERANNVNILAQNLLSQTFHYYPDPIVSIREDWPRPEKRNYVGSQCCAETSTSKTISCFNLDREIEKLSSRLATLSSETQKQPDDSFTTPYCLDPWKLSYIKSTGKSRLCCHADITTGNLGDDGFVTSNNSKEYQKIRASMFKPPLLLPECKRCNAADRFMGLDSLKKAADLLQISPSKV